MMNIFANANTLAHAVNNSVGDRFSPRPYNRFTPDDTVWWLVPSPDWPAFKYAKLFFDSRPEDVPGGAEGIYCGVNVEKGLSLRVKDFFPKEMIQSALWDWERFTTRLKSEFPSVPIPQFVWTAMSYIPPEKNVSSLESFLEQKKNFKASQAVFTMDGQQRLALASEYVNDKNIEIAQHFRTAIHPVATLGALVEALTTFPQSDWCWVDLYIGTVVKDGTVGKLWNEHLKPWTAWVGV